MSGGLLQLVAKDHRDTYLISDHDGIDDFSPKLPSRRQNSSKELISRYPTSGTTIVLPFLGDTIKEVWFEITLNVGAVVPNVYDIIDKVTLSTDLQEIESFSGEFLLILANNDAHLEPVRVCKQHGDLIIYPLQLALLEQHLPLFNLKDSEVKLQITLKDKHKNDIACSAFRFMYYYLDTAMQRKWATQGKEYLLWIKQGQHADISGRDQGFTKIMLDSSLWRGPVRELFVLIQNKDGPGRDCLEKMSLVLNGNELQEPLDGFWYNKIFPKRYYNIDNPIENLYYYPFDHSPTEVEAKSSLNLNRLALDSAQLHLKLVPGEYHVYIAGRVMNIYRNCDGLGSLMFNRQATASLDA